MDVKALKKAERIKKALPMKKGDRVRKYYYEGVVKAVSKPHGLKVKVKIDKVDTRDQHLIGMVWTCLNDGQLVVKGDS